MARGSNPVLERMRADGWYAVPDDDGSPTQEDVLDPTSPENSRDFQSEGWKMWQRVVEAASDGVRSAASAVRNKVSDELLYESDEEGYSGGDSHLIRIMKEYYIERSSSQADLPVWLFPERQQHHTKAWSSDSVPPRSRSRHTDRPPASERRIPSRECQPGPIHTSHNLREKSYSEHGNRTAQKLRQMKGNRAVVGGS